MDLTKTPLLYGTGNPSKLATMRKRMARIGITLIGLKELGQEIPEVVEDGATPLENAEKKARIYWNAFHLPVFSEDSGMRFDNVPEEFQPGVHIRTIGGRYLSDEETIAHYSALAHRFGPLVARYVTGICLITADDRVYKAMDEDMESERFLIVETPHKKRVPGFPIDALSVEIQSGKYYYDCEVQRLDKSEEEPGFLRFFRSVMEAEAGGSGISSS